jgi:DNA-binding NarL/FixJ family response regulator
MQMVAAIVEGSSNREIAQKFGVREDTVKHHLTSIFSKLGVTTRLELALFAIDHKLVSKAGTRSSAAH